MHEAHHHKEGMRGIPMISERREKRILMLSFVGGLLFAIVELVFSIFSHSQSVLMDAVYDATELIFIALILFLTPLFHKPISEEHPYGYFQVESIFLIVKGFMMLSVTLGVAVDVIESIFSGGNSVNGWEISVFQMILGAASVVVYLVMKKMNRAVSSPTVHAELMGWKLDIAYSAGMALAFFGSTFLENTPAAFLAPYFDQVVAIVVMILMLPENVKMLGGAIKDVFLFPPDEQTVETIKEACTEILNRNQFDPVFFDVTRTGRHMWVSIYFKIAGDSLEVKELQKVSEAVNKEVGKQFGNCSCELILSPQATV